MNTNPTAKRILCFGDSNTWGYIPLTKERYDVNTRWTGRLQKILGNEFEVIEEGLNSRTTVLDYPDRPWKNGKRYLRACLESQVPLDLIILFLGTNDLKYQFNQEAKDIAKNVSSLIDMIKDYFIENNKTCEILLISPTKVLKSDEKDDQYKNADIKSKDLGTEYEKVANKHNVHFIDLAKHIEPSEKDGYHLEPEAHKVIADVLEKKVREILS